MKKDSSVAMQTSSPESDQKIWQNQQEGKTVKERMWVSKITGEQTQTR